MRRTIIEQLGFVDLGNGRTTYSLFIYSTLFCSNLNYRSNRLAILILESNKVNPPRLCELCAIIDEEQTLATRHCGKPAS